MSAHESKPTDALAELTQAWQEQEAKPVDIAMETITTRAGKFQRTIRWRNGRELVAAALAVGLFLYRATSERDRPLAVLGSIAIVVGTLYVGWVMITKGRASRLPDPTVPTSEYLDWHRGELRRQRDLLDRVASWYIAPFVPGIALLSADSARRLLEQGASFGSWIAYGGSIGVMGAFFGLVVWLNRRAARKLDAEIGR
jgi:hypothetical protein